MAPLAFSDSQSNVGTFALIAMVALAATLLLFGFGFGLTPARAARWPAAARVLEEQGDVLVTSGFTILAASVALLVFFLIIPGLA